MHAAQMPSEDTHSTAHKNTHGYPCVIWRVASRTGTNNGGDVGCGGGGFEAVSDTVSAGPLALPKTHTFACPFLKQHREQGL